MSESCNLVNRLITIDTIEIQNGGRFEKTVTSQTAIRGQMWIFHIFMKITDFLISNLINYTTFDVCTHYATSTISLPHQNEASAKKLTITIFNGRRHFKLLFHHFPFGQKQNSSLSQFSQVLFRITPQRIILQCQFTTDRLT